MEYSFYGGRPGKSFIIAKDFPTYKDMETAFAKGWEYQDVGYDEYVLINTTDPRNVENGKLYRRGLNGPVYVGTIQGTPGYSPHLKIDKYSDIQESDADGLDYLYSYSDNNQGSIELVPGKEGDQFNDNIEWKMLSVRTMYYRDIEGNVIANTFDYDITENTADRTITFMDGNVERTKSYYEGRSAEETIVKVGFKFPYHVFDWEAQSIDPYENRTDDQTQFISAVTYNNLIKKLQEDSEGNDHPFYSNLQIKVPHGIKGDSIQGLEVISIEQYKKLKETEGNLYNAAQHPLWESKYEDYDPDLGLDKKILVYKYVDYRNHPAGAKITKYLADFDMINNVTIDEDGTTTIYFTHREPVVYPGLIGWVNRIELNKENFHLYAHYSNEEYEHGMPAKDLGSTKVDSTLSIAFNIDPNEEEVGGNNISNNLAYLNDTYPHGLSKDANGNSVGLEWMRGKIVTIGPNNDNTIQKNFFAFDYNLNQWYFLGNLGQVEISRVQQIAPHNDYDIAISRLDDGGICFLYTERPVAKTIVEEPPMEE